MSRETSKRQVDLEWERRVLCSDEACIGIIGPEGRCKECGKAFEGELPHQFGENRPDEDASMSSGMVETASSDVSDEVDGDEVEAANGDNEWERRTLCSDESCIGVIGSDGRCKECGKPYEQ